MWFLFKVVALSHSPYKRTVFLDTDTLLGYPVNDIFHLIKRYDVAYGFAPTRIPSSIGKKSPGELKNYAATPRINTGVLGFFRSAVDKGFFNVWERLLIVGIMKKYHLARENYGDQSEFIGVRWECPVSTVTLPTEYHVRIGSTPAFFT